MNLNLINYLKCEFTRLDKEIDEKKILLQELQSKKISLLEKQRELENQHLNAKLTNSSCIENQNKLLQRNEAVKEKFRSLNEDLKDQAEQVAHLKNLNFKNLGIKINLKALDEEVWEVTVSIGRFASRFSKGINSRFQKKIWDGVFIN